MPLRLLPIAALALTLAAAAPAGAAFRGSNGQIAYEGRASATTGAILLAPRGGGAVRRLAAPGAPADPAFSPLGRRIAFGSRTEIWVMYEDGTSVRQVTVGPEPSRDPTWSPAGDAIAFARGYAGERDLYSVGADGNGLRRLTSGGGDDEAPAWGPKGAIAFVRDGDVYVKAPRSRARPLTGGGADDRDPVWSPDARRIAFTRLAPRAAAPRSRRGQRRRPPRLRELWVMRANGSRARRLRRLPADVGSPAWSPDGRSIAFAMGRTGRRGLYTLRTTGRRLRQIASRAADPRAIDWQVRGADPVIAAAGDIACDPDTARFATGLGTNSWCHMLQTSDLLLEMDLTAVLALGDLQYEDGTLDKFQRSYDPTWGRLKAQTRPVVGNHEYRTPGAAGYFDYFNGPGVADGPAGPRDKGYYSYDVGDWHVVTLNSQCAHAAADNPYRNDCAAGSAQERWLRADLAAHPARCTLAAWHHPWFSSGIEAVNHRLQPLFQALYDHGVDVLLAGHDHGYERFAPMDAAANRDGVRGVRQFVVGTGGKNETMRRFPKPNSEVRGTSRFGVLKMTLRPNAYVWEFVRDGGSFRDEGANACH